MNQVALPLFAKELIELAMRRRTYVVRVAYAFLLLFSSWLAFQLHTLRTAVGAINYLGSGQIVLVWMGYLQNMGMFLVLPALACDVFTREKERQTIGLLFLTRLSPQTMVLEKFLSRLFPAFCLLLVSLPMLGFSYALGGVEVWQITNTALGLVTNATVLTAIAVACSALCQTTTSAFLWTYLVALVTPFMVVTGGGGSSPVDFVLLGRFLARAVFINHLDFDSLQSIAGAASVAATPLLRIQYYLQSCLPSLACGAFYLLLARIFLISRAFKKASRSWSWTSVYRRTPQELLRRIVRSKHSPQEIVARDLPELAPVAWRETQRRWMGRWMPILLAILCPLLVALIWLVNAGETNPKSQVFAAWSLSLWVITLLVLITNAASLITQERVQETLAVLLTTPLAGADIVRQKLAGLQPLFWFCLIPLCSAHVLRMLMTMPQVNRLRTPTAPYPMAFWNESTMLVIYPQLAIWMALYFSLRSRTTIAAIMKTLVTIIGLCVLPWVILMLFAVACGGLNEAWFGPIVALLLIGPADLLLYGYTTDCLPPGFDEEYWPLLLNTVIHGSLWWWFRSQSLKNADRLLGRGSRRTRATESELPGTVPESAAPAIP